MFRKKIHGQMSDSFINAAFVVLSGGLQDAYTYNCRGEVFANAQTGNIVLMGTNLFKGEWASCLRYLVPLLAFLSGIFIAESIHNRCKHAEKIHWRQIIVLIEIVLLFVVGFFPERFNAAANALVSFVCALQVQTFHKVRGHVYASTMCIGNMRSGMETLYAYILNRDKHILHKALTYFGVILLFAVGAGAGSLLSEIFAERTIWISCALLSVSFAVMFIKYECEES